MISTIDTVIIIVYIFLMFTLGWLLGKNNRDQKDFFLAGRKMPWLPIAFSVGATTISGNGFIGAPGWAYNDGIAPFMIQAGIPLAIFFVMFTTIPVIYNLKITSVYEYIEMRLGIYSRLLSVFGFIANSLIQISSMVFIASLVLQSITGWDLEIIVPLIVISALIYTILGGIKAVIWTDFIQMLVMWLGLIVAFFVILNHLELGFLDTIENLRGQGKMQALDFSWDMSSTNTFWATLIGGTIMWIRYFGFDQGQVQRVLTARSIKDVKISFMLSAFVLNLLFFFFMIIGILLFVFFDNKKFDSANNVMIEFITSHLPVGVIGLLIVSVFATAMSSVDSLLNSMTTVYVKDIHERFFIKSKEKELSLKASRIIAGVMGVFIVIITILGFSGTAKSVLEVVGSYISYITGPMVGAFFLSLFTTRANDKGTAVGFILGFIFILLFGNLTNVSWIWRPIIGGGVTFIVGYIASFISKSNKTKEEIEIYTVIGHKKSISHNHTEDGVSIQPLRMDKYTLITLIFFFLQYIILMLIA